MAANDQQQGGGKNAQRAPGAQGDDPQALQQALQRQPEGLIGQTDENRYVDGSTTYDTLPDQGNSGQGGGAKS